MPDIVEQVARAIHDTEHNPAPDRCWNTDSTLDRAMFLDEAEAAIAAVRAFDKEAGMVLVSRELASTAAAIAGAYGYRDVVADLRAALEDS